MSAGALRGQKASDPGAGTTGRGESPHVGVVG